MESSGFGSTQPRRGLKQIRYEGDAQERRRENVKAFEEVLEAYVQARFASPLVSNFGILNAVKIFNREWSPDAPASENSIEQALDKAGAYRHRRWSVDQCCLVVDVERSIEKALESAELRNRVWEWHVQPELQLTPKPKLTAEESKIYSQIVQKCGAKFKSVGIWPLWQYFGLRERKLKPTKAFKAGLKV